MRAALSQSSVSPWPLRRVIVSLLLAAGSLPALHAQSVSFAGATPSVNFGAANVCAAGATTPAPCSQTLTLTYNVTESGTLGAPQVLTLGASNLDFRLASGSTCSGAVTAGNSCVVKVTFGPLAPGARNGAVEILDSTGNVVANTYIYGTGTGPAIAFSPSLQITLGSGFYSPTGLAVDGSGNIFVADTSNNAVKEILAAGGYTTVNTLGSGFYSPHGVAVDGRGNVFVGDSGNNAVKEILAAGGYATVKILATGFNFPWGVAVDGSGNAYVSDFYNAAVKEILAAGGYTTVNTLANVDSGLNGPTGLAVDASGNVFVADAYNAAVREIPAAGGYPTVLASGFYDPLGVAVDASGNVFVADAENGAVKEILAAGGYASVSTLATGFQTLAGVTTDGRGNVYISDLDNNRVVEIQRSQPPALSFATTPIGSTSSDSPQSVTVQNIGNAPLDAAGAGLTVSLNWDQVTGGGTPSDCASSFTLAPSAECNLSISYMPTAAEPLTGAVTLTDNALNATGPNYATQTISLAGTGMAAPLAQVSATVLNYGTIAYASSETLPLTITNVGTGTLTIAPSIDGQSYTIAGNTCGAGVTAGQSCTLQVEFAPATATVHDNILTLQTNGATNPIVKLNGAATGVGTMTTVLNFGTIPLGTTAVLPVVYTNTAATGTVAIGATASSPANYKILTTAQNTCQAGLAAGQSCTLPVEFSPASVGVQNDLLTVSLSDDGPALSTIMLVGAASEAGPQSAVNFGSVNVCASGQTSPAPCSQTLTLTYNISAGTTVGSIRILTLGAPNLDFTAKANDASTTLCKTQTYNAATTCTVDVTFAPLAPGQRNGAVALQDGSGNPVAMTYIYGTGTGAAIAFSPSVQISLGSGFYSPEGLAVDASGNIFVADTNNHAVKEILAAGGYTTTRTLGSGFSYTRGVAVDGAGNVFVADYGNNEVKEILAESGYTTVKTVASGFTVQGLTVDGSGNLFLADTNDPLVKEILAEGGYTTVKTLGGGFGFSGPSDVAVDGSGNVYVSDFYNAAVYEILAAGGYTTVKTLGVGFVHPGGVAVDASGNVFVADYDYFHSNSEVYEILAAGGYTTVNTLASGFLTMEGIAVDGSGNVYFDDQVENLVVEIQRSQPPALSFATTKIGGTSADSPQSVQFQNIGNQPLTGDGTLSDTVDFTQVAGSGTPVNCTYDLSLAPGAECNLSISFTPQSTGPLTGTLTLSDNSLNGTPATQRISLQGVGIVSAQITGVSANYGALYSIVTLTGTNFGATQGSSTVTFNGIVAPVLSWSNESITVTVPYRATTGNILVTVAGEASNGVPFTVEPTPTVTGISPTSGAIGTLVTITGTNLLDAQGHGEVWLYNLPIPIVSQSSTSLQVRIPTGAVSGVMNVHINGVGLATPVFTVAGSPAQPHITSLSANYGAPYAYVTLTGSSFGAIQGSSTVTFNGVAAPAVWGNSSIFVAVPLHATTGNVVVTVAGQASNGIAFTVEPSPSVTGISPSSGPVGTTVTISGQNLVDAEGHGTVYFGGISLPILNPTNTSIQVVTPAGASSGVFDVHINGVGVFTTTFTVN